MTQTRAHHQKCTHTKLTLRCAQGGRENGSKIQIICNSDQITIFSNHSSQNSLIIQCNYCEPPIVSLLVLCIVHILFTDLYKHLVC